MTTEAKVGAFVLGCFSILAFTIIYLMHAQFSGDTVPYRTYLTSKAERLLLRQR